MNEWMETEKKPIKMVQRKQRSKTSKRNFFEMQKQEKVG